MAIHQAFEELAFAAIDFELTPEESAAFHGHLDGCPDCRILWQRIRTDQATVREVAVVPSPPRVRAAVLAAAGHRTPRRAAWQLVAVAALLVVALGAAMLTVGAILERLRGADSPIGWESVAPGAVLAAADGSVHLTDISFGRGRYVVVNDGTNGPRVAWSDDGRTWQGAAWTEQDAEIEDVVFVAGRRPDEQFALVGAQAGRPAVWWSADGASWRLEIVRDGPGRASGIAALDETVMVVGRTSQVVEQEGISEELISPAAWRRTPEGQGRWVPTSIPGDDGSGGGIIGIAADRSGFVALTTAGSTLGSPTGEKWTLVAGDGPVGETMVIASGGEAVVAIWNQSAGPAIRVFSGGRWQEPSPLPQAASAVVRSVVYRDGQYVAGGSGPAGALTWLSHDGVSWTVGGVIDGSSAALINDLAWGGTQVVAVGARGNVGAVWIGREVEE